MNNKKLLIGGVNQDDAEYLLDPKEYLNALNIRFASTESGAVGRLSSIEGTTLKAVTLNSSGARVTWNPPAGTNQVIGSFSDTVNRRLFWFNWNSNSDHGIYCYAADQDVIYTVLLNDNVTGGLNFQQNKFIHSVAMVDNLLYWTDDVNEPRRININSGIAAYHPTYFSVDRPYALPVDQSIITIVRPQPAFAPTAAYTNQAAQGDAIYSDGFQAAYRFVFKDKEVSVFSSLSKLVRNAEAGYIDFTIPTSQKIPQDVDKIELAVRYYSDKRMIVFRTWDRAVDEAKFNAHNAGTAGQLTYRFYNKEVGVAVDNATSVKLYDSVPVQAGTLEIARNRLFLGDTLTGYDTPRTTSLSLSQNSSSAADDLVCYKSGGSYKFGVIFYDAFGRSSGVVTKDTLVYTTPDRIETPTDMVTSVGWTLSNTNAINQIPVWAKYYSIVRTRARNKSFFIQFKPSEIKEVARNTDGTYNLSATSTNRIGWGFRLNDLSSYGLGYSLNAGDVALVYNGSDIFRLNVTDTFSDYVITEFGGTFTTSDTVIVEIYSPAAQATNEFYFETGDKYTVTNAGTVSRQYGTTSGTITGDVVLRTRSGLSGYYAEVMNENDKIWKQWSDNTGRTFLEITDTVKRRTTNVSFSNVYGVGVNGLSTFDVLDFYLMPIELGTLERLVLTSKVQLEGNVMLGIFTEESASIYLGESQVFDATGAAFLAKSSGVIGQVNVMRGSFGTIHPESVFEWQGSVVFFDANKGVWVRYDVNGLFPISLNKMAKYFRKVGQDIVRIDQTEYSYASPNQPIRVLGAIDPYHGEYISQMPRMFVNPKNEVLVDMELASTNYNFTTAAATLSVSPGSLSGFTYEQGTGPSTGQSFTVSGSGLNVNGTITVTGSTDYEVSLDDSNYADTVIYSYSGTSTSRGVYVRLKQGRAFGSYNSQTVAVTGSGQTANLTVSGTVSASTTPLLVATPNVLSGINYTQGSGPSATSVYALTGTALTPGSGNITINIPSGYEASSDGTTWNETSMTVAYTGGALASTNISVRLKAGLSAGTFNSTMSISGGGASTSVSLFGTVFSTGGGITYYRYSPVGRGATPAQACNEFFNNPVALFSDRDTDTFGAGAQLFVNGSGTPFSGFGYVFMNGANYDVSGNVITGFSTIQC
jgi:hypothetical protein